MALIGDGTSMTFSLRTILWTLVALGAWLANIPAVHGSDQRLSMIGCVTAWFAIVICYVEWRMEAALVFHFGGPILCLLASFPLYSPYEATVAGCFVTTLFGFPASVICRGKDCVDFYASPHSRSESPEWQ